MDNSAIYYEVGDLVYFKIPDGPMMMVKEVIQPSPLESSIVKYQCTWFDKNKNLLTAVFEGRFLVRCQN